MKYLILPFFIIIAGYSFSQRKLAIDKVVHDKKLYTPYIFDDGTSIIIENQTVNLPNYFLNSYNAEGEVIQQRKLEDSYWPEMFSAKEKYWLYYKVGGKKMTILHTDFSGNTIETEVKDNCFNYQRAFTLINEKGNMEIYLKHIRSNYKMEKNMIP